MVDAVVVVVVAVDVVCCFFFFGGVCIHHLLGGEGNMQIEMVWSNDSEGIRTPAGRAQWISSPSP